MNPKIALSITEGRVIRDLFENNFLEMLRAHGMDMVCFTGAARVPEFASRWSGPGVTFFPLKPYDLDVSTRRALRLRGLLLRYARWALPAWAKWISRLPQPQPEVADRMRDARLAVITHPMSHAEYPVFRAALDLEVPTLGVLRSWDNLYKGLSLTTDILVVWNEVNRSEAVHMMGYPPEKVKVIGGAQFDPYFAPDSVWTRERFAEHYRLDPARPTILLATLGAFLHLYDETYLVDWLLGVMENGGLPGRPQLVIRLHPASRPEYFEKYLSHPDVRLSYIRDYVPTLGWTMSRPEVIAVANLLRHASVVVSPGSTITIESAIFDTPTVVPLFHTYQPELGQKQYNFHLGNHFKRLRELSLVPFANTPDELLAAIKHALEDRAWYRAERLRLSQNYIHFMDGRSTERFMALVSEIAAGGVH